MKKIPLWEEQAPQQLAEIIQYYPVPLPEGVRAPFKNVIISEKWRNTPIQGVGVRLAGALDALRNNQLLDAAQERALRYALFVVSALRQGASETAIQELDDLQTLFWRLTHHEDVNVTLYIPDMPLPQVISGWQG